jgi:hypothetical protein
MRVDVGWYLVLVMRIEMISFHPMKRVPIVSSSKE